MQILEFMDLSCMVWEGQMQNCKENILASFIIMSINEIQGIEKNVFFSVPIFIRFQNI